MLLTGLSIFVLMVTGSFFATLMPRNVEPSEAIQDGI